MAAQFNGVSLGTVIRHRKEFIQIDDSLEYKRCRVQLHAQGIVLRDTVPGLQIKTKSQQVCRAGEFLVAEIDAKVGGYGIVPPALSGAVVSSHYFLFEIDETRLDQRYLGYFVRTTKFSDQVAAQGTTNYAAIRPNHVLHYTIPLPSLPEQRRVVARIDELAAKIEEVQTLRQNTAETIEAIERALIFGLPANLTPLTPMSKLVKLRSHDVAVQADEKYQFAGVYSFGRGVFRGENRAGMDFAYEKLGRLQASDFVYPKLMAWEGALGIVPPECDGCFVSPEFPIFEVNQNRVLPETLDVYFRTPEVWSRLGGTSTGTNVRRRRLNPSDFLAHLLPLPPMPVQMKLREIRSWATTLMRLRRETQAELGALLPAILDRAFRGEL